MPRTTQRLVLGLGFLLVGALLTVLDRSNASLGLSGLGPGFAIGGLVVLTIAVTSRQTERRSEFGGRDVDGELDGGAQDR